MKIIGEQPLTATIGRVIHLLLDDGRVATIKEVNKPTIFSFTDITIEGERTGDEKFNEQLKKVQEFLHWYSE